MIEWNADRLLTALVVAPAGAALLARLEAEQRSEELPFPWRWQSADSVDPDSVDGAVSSVSEKPVGELLAEVVEAVARRRALPAIAPCSRARQSGSLQLWRCGFSPASE